MSPFKMFVRLLSMLLVLTIAASPHSGWARHDGGPRVRNITVTIRNTAPIAARVRLIGRIGDDQDSTVLGNRVLQPNQEYTWRLRNIGSYGAVRFDAFKANSDNNDYTVTISHFNTLKLEVRKGPSRNSKLTLFAVSST